jgi:hypothetical protein
VAPCRKVLDPGVLMRLIEKVTAEQRRNTWRP